MDQLKLDHTTGKSYADYCEAGKPYGKTGFVKWLHEQYAEYIDQLLKRQSIADAAITGLRPKE